MQVVEEPTIPLIEALMSDPTTDVILATGGVAVVRAAYRSGNPAIGVGPGNVPCLVDHTADLAAAAERLMDSKSFDNSILCTNESCVIVEERCADAFERELGRHGGHVLSPDDVPTVREKLYPDGRLRIELIGKDGRRSPPKPGSGFRRRRACSWRRSRSSCPRSRWRARRCSRCSGSCACPTRAAASTPPAPCCGSAAPGHSAVIHSRDPRTIMAYGAAVKVLRVAVNVGGSTGSAGIDTNLAPTMTIGTGFYGRSSLGENLEPRHLINLTRVAYTNDPSEPFGDFTGLEPWSRRAEPPSPSRRGALSADAADARDEIRRIVLEELRELVKR